MRLGAVISTAGGLHHVFERAAEMGCDSLMLFTKNNRQWHADPISDEDLYHLNDADRAAKRLSMLPGSLGEALAEFQTDVLVRETLGEHIFGRFLEAKGLEWQAFSRAVTEWELSRYLPIY